MPRARGARPERPAQEARSRSAVLHVLHKAKGVRVRDVEKAVHAAMGWEELGKQESD